MNCPHCDNHFRSTDVKITESRAIKNENLGFVFCPNCQKQIVVKITQTLTPIGYHRRDTD